jgi:hypothetical protein
MHRKFYTVIASMIIMAVMAFFCTFTPWVYDDFGLGSGGSSLYSMFMDQLREHKIWSGKFVGHFMARVLLHGPVWLHPVLTPIIFMGLIFSGVVLVLGIDWRKKICAWHIILVSGLTWFALPAFGTVFFWRTGAPDYGYSLAFVTAFLVPYRFLIDKKEYKLPKGMFFIIPGFLAGCSNENIGALAILLALIATIYRYRTSRSWGIWSISGITGAITGWLVMMAAPGTAVRLAEIGGIERIPIFSLESFHRFLAFLGSQELEMIPYMLIAAAAVWKLHKDGNLKPSTYLPGLVLFLMTQASILAFVLSPSTPVRAMSATFFYMVLCCFSFIVACDFKNTNAETIYTVFCVVLMYSIFIESRVFIQAQPVIEARNQAMLNNKVTARSFDYPKTDKYFFPGYDIKEIESYESKKFKMVPWNETTPICNIDGNVISALVVCNFIYLKDLPAHAIKVHVAAVVHRQTLASVIQTLILLVSPLADKEATSTSAISLRYVPASTKDIQDGKAVVHIPGIRDIHDVAYIAIEEEGKGLVWRRALTKSTGK